MTGALMTGQSLTVNALTDIPVYCVNCYDRGLVPPVIFLSRAW